MFVNLDKKSKNFNDERGYLSVLYEQSDLVIKRSFSRATVFRGMHFQKHPMKQTKLIRVLSGEIIDIIFDPNLLPHVFYIKNIKSSLNWTKIGSQYAHGFYAVTDTDFEYICHGAYNLEAECTFGVRRLLMDELGLSSLIMSAKDLAATEVEMSGATLIQMT